MSENEPTGKLPMPIEDKDDGPPSALMALAPHLREFVELHEVQKKTYAECVEAIFPGRYKNAKDQGWQWYWRKDVQRAIAELRAEAVKLVKRSEADVLRGMWAVADWSLADKDANGAMRALESLANYHGMTKNRTEVSGPNGGPIETANRTVSTNVPDDPVEASRFYRDMIQADKPKK